MVVGVAMIVKDILGLHHIFRLLDGYTLTIEGPKITLDEGFEIRALRWTDLNVNVQVEQEAHEG